MSDWAAGIIGTLIFGTLICVGVLYILPYVVLGAAYLGVCYFLGKVFICQVSQVYRLTSTSAFTLVLLAVVSAPWAFILVEWAREDRLWAYLLTVPIFLSMAVVTLGAWGHAKRYPTWAAAKKIEAARLKGEAKLKDLESDIARVSGAIQALEREHDAMLQERNELTARVRAMCTETGDQRLRILLKEQMERSLAEVPLAALETRLASLKGLRKLEWSHELESCLVKIAVVDRKTGDAYRRIARKREEFASLEAAKKEMLERQGMLEQQAREARAALDSMKTQRLVLD